MCISAEFDTEWDCDCVRFVCGGSIVLFGILSDKRGCGAIPVVEESSKQINECLQIQYVCVVMIALNSIMARLRPQICLHLICIHTSCLSSRLVDVGRQHEFARL